MGSELAILLAIITESDEIFFNNSAAFHESTIGRRSVKSPHAQ